LVPPEIRRGFSLSSSRPSAAYLEEMSLFFASLVLDNSQGSFPYKREMILKYVAPELFETVKNQLLKAQGRYTQEGLSTHFRPLEVQVEVPQLQAQVKGELVSFIGGRKMTEARETFVIHYAYKSGFLSILSFKTGPLEPSSPGTESLETGSLETGGSL
jgi:conjugal transfer pilus assembly protein TraE